MRRTISLGVLLLVLSGCGPGSGSADHAQTASTAPAPTVAAPAPTAAAPAAKPAGPIWFEPSALSTCGRPQKVTVYWNVGPHSDVKQVNVMAVKKDKTEVLFLAGGRHGSRETGPWMRGGSEMALRNKVDGTELGRVTVDSLPCH